LGLFSLKINYLFRGFEMKLRGIVSVGAKFHAQYTAEALNKEGMLYKFFVGKKINSKIIPKDKIKINILPSGIGYILRNIPLFGGKIPYNIISDTLFDMISKLSKVPNNIDFFIGFNNYSLFQMRKLKKKGIKIILEQRIAHVNTELEIYKREFGHIPSNLSQLMVKRKLNEYECADYILVPSKFVWDSMINNGVPEKKLIKVPYGYNSELFYNQGHVKDKLKKSFRLLFVGQIGFRKGLRYILKAVKNLKDQGFNLDLILVGNIDRDFQEFLNKYHGYFEYINFIPQEELLDLYNNSDVFIFPSLCEGSALVTYEAMACGLPLIVTENAGTIVTHSHDGLVVEPSNSDVIEEAILTLLENSSELLRMSKNALITSKTYSWSNYSQRLINELEKVLN
jgi:glycosyltransferase involved in cell wall biosynthesis